MENTSATHSNVTSPPNELINMENVIPSLNVPIANAINKVDWSKLKQPTLDTIMRECEPGEDPTFRKNSQTSRMEQSPGQP